MQVAAALTARRCVQTLPGNRMRPFTTLTLLASLCACQSYVAVPVQPVRLVAVAQRSQAPSAPGPVLRRADYTAQQFASFFAADVEVGVAGSRQPQGMEAMKLALQRPGFLRNASKIVVAFFSDAEDCSDPAHRLSMLTKDPATGNVVDQCAIMARRGAPSALEPVASDVVAAGGSGDPEGGPGAGAAVVPGDAGGPRGAGRTEAGVRAGERVPAGQYGRWAGGAVRGAVFVAAG